MADKFDKVTNSIEKKGIVPPKLPVGPNQSGKNPGSGKKGGGIVPPAFPSGPTKPGRNPGSVKK
jgi:hypothetical protein